MKYKIGDKVKLTKSYDDFKNGIKHLKGDNGVIEKFGDYEGWAWIKINGVKKDIWYYDLELIENNCTKNTNQNCQDVYCNHENKKKVQMIYTSYLLCETCGKDLGDC